VPVPSLVCDLQALPEERHGLRDVSFEHFQCAEVPELDGYDVQSSQFPVQPEILPIELSRLADVAVDARRRGEHVERGDGVRLLAPRSGDRQARLRSEEHTSELQSRVELVCRLLLEKKNQEHGAYSTTR